MPLWDLADPPCGDCLLEARCPAVRAFERSRTYEAYRALIPTGFITLTDRTLSCSSYRRDARWHRVKAPPLISSHSRAGRTISVAGAIAVRGASTPWRAQHHAAARRGMARKQGLLGGVKGPQPKPSPTHEALLGEIPDIVTGAPQIGRMFRGSTEGDW